MRYLRCGDVPPILPVMRYLLSWAKSDWFGHCGSRMGPTALSPNLSAWYLFWHDR